MNRLRTLLAVGITALAAAFAPAAAQDETKITSAADGLLVHELYERMELLMLRCDLETGETPRFGNAWTEWDARNSHARDPADVVLAHHGVTYDRVATRALVLVGVFGTFADLGDEAASFCVEWEEEVYAGTADLSTTHSDLFYSLLASDQAIADLKQ